MEKAKRDLIKAQKELALCYKKMEKARKIFFKEEAKEAKKRATLKKKNNKSKSLKSKSKSLKSKSKSLKSKSKSKKSMRGGGGSDWLSTVNSRGNVNAPNDHWGVDGAKWFSQFDKSGGYISNSDLRKGNIDISNVPKIPTGFDRNTQSNLLLSNSSDLGTQRV